MRRLDLLVLPLCTALFACATAPKPQMGKLSDLSRVEGPAQYCEHQVPEQVCTRHHPELVAKFKAVGDWCGEHEVPESQCLKCHPELTFEKVPALPEGADVQVLSKAGEEIGELAPAAVRGKVTVFDFYADWCAPCREVDVHMAKVMAARTDVAVRKLNVVDWESAAARRYLSEAKGLPYLVVFGRDGAEVKRIQGFDLAELDAAIAEGAAR